MYGHQMLLYINLYDIQYTQKCTHIPKNFYHELPLRHGTKDHQKERRGKCLCRTTCGKNLEKLTIKNKGFLVRNEIIPSKTQITMKQYVACHQKYGFLLVFTIKNSDFMSQNMGFTSFYHQKFEFDQFSQPKMCIYQPKLCFHQPKWRFTSQNCLT